MQEPMNFKRNRKLLIIALAFLIGACNNKPENNYPQEEYAKSEEEMTANTPEWTKNSNIYEVNIRQYTKEGTFNAFRTHLPRLQQMGVDILWLMPVNPIGELNRKGSKGSYYSVKDYKAVNPEFGTLEDFKLLVNDIHSMGMHIIIDWVANHSAWDNSWAKTNPEFYTKDEKGNFKPPVDDWSDVIDLNYENNEMRDAMIDALQFWIKECNIDGFRCDVADMVPVDFWIQARTALDTIKPVFMLAEAENTEIHQAFDMTYSWKLMHAMNAIATGEKSAKEIDSVLSWESDHFSKQDYRMRFITNHDENSWNGTEFERLGEMYKPFAVMCATLPGMPLVYSGQESALNKRLEFFDKDYIDWKNYELSDFYSELLQLKRNCSALQNGPSQGSFNRIHTNIDDKLYCFSMEDEASSLVVMLNFSADSVTCNLDLSKYSGAYYDLLGKQFARLDSTKEISFAPYGSYLFKRQ